MLACRPLAFATVLISALLLPSLAAQAHETLPPDWCMQEGQQPEIVVKFDFDGPQLREVMDKCGIVDSTDHWHAASEAMSAYCGIVAPSKSAMPVIFGPSTYLSEDHHASYRIEQGLKGACVVCPPRPGR
ncbi:hypothetical protein [Luteimonas aquatica]|uniref:hypothetical protein n=1 Tax=Luteimonas aquatica TaxID=450364 RepID=UPI001F58077C|nr:hypothetical protein [Luteimonas aquatica]